LNSSRPRRPKQKKVQVEDRSVPFSGALEVESLRTAAAARKARMALERAPLMRAPTPAQILDAKFREAF
jgi:hypothetical protein